MTPEQKARVSIDALLTAAGWYVCDMADANIHAARGVAIREFPLNPGYGFADYLLYIDSKAAGDRCLSLVRSVEAEVDANLKRAQALRQSMLSKAFSVHQ